MIHLKEQQTWHQFNIKPCLISPQTISRQGFNENKERLNFGNSAMLNHTTAF